MKKMSISIRLWATAGLLSLSSILSSGLRADQYPVDAIPEAIKNKADAVLRLEQRSIEQKDQNEATEKVTLAITVLNERGERHSRFLVSQDKFSELRSFSGMLLSPTGKVTKKIGKGDLNQTQISEHLTTDSYWIYYSCPTASYPYTVVYTYEIRHKNGVAWYPSFFPQDFGLGVEKAEYRLSIPSGLGIRYKANTLAPEPTREMLDKDSVFTWSCSQLEVIEEEPLCPPISELSPLVVISPKEFCMDKICGDMSSWKSTGQYLSQLVDGKELLPAETRQKVKEIAARGKDERETVRLLYEYLQETTRYVSIQLGIGGWMPIAADKVAKSGFGDCKALTNYMKAMLTEAGIPSVYATINTDKKRMHPDFSSMFQANHVILMVPLQSDTLWLECTSQQLPFNYRHSRIAGHDALLVCGENSRLCTVTDRAAGDNEESNRFDIRIQPDGSIRSEIGSRYKHHAVEKVMDFVLNLPEKDKVNYLAEKYAISKPRISDIQSDYKKQEVPEALITYRLDAEKYGTLTGSRLFVPTNPTKSYLRNIFSATERKQDIRLNAPIERNDTIVFHLPEGYSIESGPKPFELKSEFGSYSCRISDENGVIQFSHHLHIPAGRYKKEQYPALKEFFKQIDSRVSGRLVITQRKE